MTELDVLSDWRRPAGHLDRKVCGVVALGVVVTLAVTMVGPRWFWSAYGDASVSKFWIRNGLTLLVGPLLMCALALRGTSPSLRLALALPLAHVVAIAGAWSTWISIAPRLPDAVAAGPIVRALPMGPSVVVAFAMCAAIGRAAGRRRDWLHNTVVMALASLLAVGLWLPLAASWYCRDVTWLSWQELGDTHAAGIAAFVLVPPLCAAIAYTLLQHQVRWLAGFVVPLLLMFAIAVRSDASQLELAMYGNFVHLLLALVMTSIASIAALGLALLARARRAQRMLASARTGTITSDGAALVLEIPSYLRGPRLLSQPFTIETAAGPLLVPPGVEILARIPPISTQLRDGEALELARHGDDVLVGGFEDPDPAHPFRGSLAPQPGPDGLVVARAGDTAFGEADIALVLWRPCVAYLVIGITVALPGLIAALTMR